MRVPRSRLPQDPAHWHGFLRDYFCDKDAVVKQSGESIDLELHWPGAADRHVDPALDAGLRWWGRGVTLGSMWAARWREGSIMTSLYDQWTLLSWSEWLARKQGGGVERTVIMHVDDHRDLGSPRLHLINGKLVDATTHDVVALDEPATVVRAIESGAIGMGSFMTPFLWQYPGTEVRHLCQPPKMTAEVRRAYSLGLVADTLLDPAARRPAVDLVDAAGGSGKYLGTHDTRSWSDGVEGLSALVHIDMDYFNNRYDGDSAWTERSPRLDPDLHAIYLKVDELVEALASSKAVIEDVAIAYSPGFFPSEYWEPVDLRLRAGLARIL